MKIQFSYYDLFNGLRGFAILLVLYAHSFLSAPILENFHIGNGGFIGVDIFFVLSSFLITSLLIKEFLSFGNISIKLFYTRRFIRLLPPLLFALAIFIPIVWTISCKTALKEMFYSLTYSTNIARSLYHYISPSLQPTFFAHTWSLATEEQFYFVFPFFLVFIINKKISFFLNPFILLITLLGFFSTALLFRPILKDGIYDFPIWRIGEFFIGFVTALVHANFHWHNTLLEKASFLLIPKERIDAVAMLLKSRRLTWIAFTILFVIVVFAKVNSWTTLSCGHLAGCITTAFLILQITIYPNKDIKKILGQDVLKKIGIISYGLYLYHFPVLMLERFFLKTHPQFNEILATEKYFNHLVCLVLQDSLLVSITLIISLISYKFIEVPMFRYKSIFAR
jgi:peptidoglycan/LPS O-acetylase OafA/YrhL